MRLTQPGFRQPATLTEWISQYRPTEIRRRRRTRKCETLVNAAVTACAARELCKPVLALAEAWPDELEPNLAYALVREKTRQKQGMLELWTDLHERFPDAFTALQYRVRWLMRMRRPEEARALVEADTVGMPSWPIRQMQLAELYWELKDTAAAVACSERLIADYPFYVKGRVAYAKRLKAGGQLIRARAVLAPVRSSTAEMSTGSIRLVQDLYQALPVLQRRVPDQFTSDANLSCVALEVAINRYHRRRVPETPCDQLGSVALITGSLGPGGAERQLARAAAWFETVKRSSGELAGVNLAGPFDVVVRSLTADSDSDFFLDVVSKANVVTRQIDDMPVIPLDRLGIEDPELQALLGVLPAKVIYGVQRLVRYFREAGTETAYIWQDGAVLFAGLAALIAGVPKIVVSIRGQPPVIRRHLYTPEYDGMYRTLARVPNVEFISNNRASAEAYADWLDISPERFTIIPNGVEKLPSEGTDIEHAQWSAFDASTSDATETIGGVFRFDTDKRPQRWINFARDYLASHPAARFVLVGGGRMLNDCRSMARKYGIDHRILFVGPSSQVGYWLTHMDVFVLLSRFEGLPNVLIEAQLSGVAVVSTPAGGACEAFMEGTTGLALTCAENPSLEELCDKVARILHRRNFPLECGEQAITFASANFSTRRMVAQTAYALARKCVPAEIAADTGAGVSH